MVRWKCSTNSKYNISESSLSPAKCFIIQQVSRYPHSIMHINIHMYIYTVLTHIQLVQFYQVSCPLEDSIHLFQSS